MFDTQLQFQRWNRFNLLQDYELGLPEKWTVWIDFQNFHEAGFFGCPIEYINGEVPDTHPVFADAPERVMENGIPDPFSNLLARGLRYFERFKERAARETFLGRPIEVRGSSEGTDGVFTTACNLFGPDVVCIMMIEEPDRLRTLLDFIFEATVRRMRAWRKLLGIPIPQPDFGHADDSIALISTEMYCEFIMPYHRRLCEAFAAPGPCSIHLCGDSTRHFRTLRDDLNILSFDTGFPVDFGKLRQDLGLKVSINGGPHVQLLRASTPEQVRAEVRRILETGILEGGLFTLREGNNLAPGTPLENTEAMYHAGREFGFRNGRC